MIRQAIRALAQLFERQTHITAIADDTQRRSLIAAGDDVEPVERPIELLQARPREGRDRTLVVRPMPDQRVARLPEKNRTGRHSGNLTQLLLASHSSMARKRSLRTLILALMVATVVSAERREVGARCLLAYASTLPIVAGWYDVAARNGK